MANSIPTTHGLLQEFDLTEPSRFLGLLQVSKTKSDDLLFRGCGNAKYDLLPSALRSDGSLKLKNIFKATQPQIKNYSIKNDSDRAIVECVALSQFYKFANRQGLNLPALPQNIHEFLTASCTQNGGLLEHEADFFGHINWPVGKFEQPLGLAQHYGLPTRLLDWTDDLFVAAYFAARSGMECLKEDSNSASKLAVWLVSRTQVNRFSIEDNATKSLPYRIKVFDVPYAGNPNLAAQRGVFSLVVPKRSDPHQFTDANNFSVLTALNAINLQLNDASRTEIFGKFEKPFILKVTLPITKSNELMKLLHQNGYNYSRLFPGFAGCVKSIDELLDLQA